MSKLSLWNKDFIILFLANFFVALTFYLLMTTLTVYAIEQFHASESEAGLASSIFIIGALFSRLFAGKYQEVIGRKKLLYGSLLLFLMVTLLYFLIESLALLLIIRLIHGIAFGIATTVMSTAIMGIIPAERIGEGISYFSLSPTIATAIGPFIGLLVLRHADYQMIFVVCTLFSVASILSVLFCNIPKASINREQMAAMKKFRFKDFFEKKALPISIIMFFMGMAYSAIVTFINAYAIKINLTEAAGFFFIIYAVFILISRPFTGRLLDFKGDNIVMYPAFILFAISLILISQAEHGFMLLLAGALVGLGLGTLLSCSQAIAIKQSPKHRVGLATSTFFFCMDGGMGIGPFLTGYFIPIFDYRGMYLILAAVIISTMFLYYLLHGKNAVSHKQSSYAV